MDKLLGFIHKYLTRPLVSIGEQKHLRSINKGITTIIPLVIVGSIFLFITRLPIPFWSDFVKAYEAILLIPISVTFGLLALFLVIVAAYYMAKEFTLDLIQTPLIALSAFLLIHLTPELKINTDYFGVDGFFTAIIVTIFTVEVLKLCNKYLVKIKAPKGVPEAVMKSFLTWIPSLVIMTIILIIRVSFEWNISEYVNLLFQPLIIFIDSWWGISIFMIIRVTLWFTGVHGGSVLGLIFDPIFILLLALNAEAFMLGEPIPHIVGTGFLILVLIGGGGATLPLVFLLIRSKVEDFREIGRTALPSSIFEINEIVVYGLQMVRNPMLMIPYLINSLVLTIGTFLLMHFNIIGKPVILIPWTTPPIIGHYLVTGGNWQAVVWGLTSIVIAGMVYYPFFKIHEKRVLKEMLINDFDQVKE